MYNSSKCVQHMTEGYSTTIGTSTTHPVHQICKERHRRGNKTVNTGRLDSC